MALNYLLSPFTFCKAVRNNTRFVSFSFQTKSAWNGEGEGEATLMLLVVGRKRKLSGAIKAFIKLYQQFRPVL